MGGRKIDSCFARARVLFGEGRDFWFGTRKDYSTILYLHIIIQRISTHVHS